MEWSCPLTEIPLIFFCFNGKIGGKEEGPVKTATVLSFDLEREKEKKFCSETVNGSLRYRRIYVVAWFITAKQYVKFFKKGVGVNEHFLPYRIVFKNKKKRRISSRRQRRRRF